MRAAKPGSFIAWPASSVRRGSVAPARIANGGEHEQCCRSGPGKPVHNSDDQRRHRPIELEPLQATIEPGHRSFLFAVLVRLRLVAVVMTVNIVAMAVRVRMH